MAFVTSRIWVPSEFLTKGLCILFLFGLVACDNKRVKNVQTELSALKLNVAELETLAEQSDESAISSEGKLKELSQILEAMMETSKSDSSAIMTLQTELGVEKGKIKALEHKYEELVSVLSSIEGALNDVREASIQQQNDERLAALANAQAEAERRARNMQNSIPIRKRIQELETMRSRIAAKAGLIPQPTISGMDAATGYKLLEEQLAARRQMMAEIQRELDLVDGQIAREYEKLRAFLNQ